MVMSSLIRINQTSDFCSVTKIVGERSNHYQPLQDDFLQRQIRKNVRKPAVGQQEVLKHLPCGL